MQATDLLVSEVFRHGVEVHGDTPLLHYRGEATERRTFADLAGEVERLAKALDGLGVEQGDVVATLCWNTPSHLAAYFAVPGMGAVLHTLNLRLTDAQLIYAARDAGDRVVIVDADLVPQLERLLPQLPTVEHVVVVGAAQPQLTADAKVHSYDELLGTGDAGWTWPAVDERSAAMLCHTTGTTGDPKGVAYSHRSIYLHTLTISSGSAFAFSDADRVLPVVPMFHANAWGWPHAAWLAGAEIIFTGRFLQAEHLARIFAEHRPTAAAAVPTIWTQLAASARDAGTDLSSLRLAVAGGSPLSAELAARMRAEHGVPLTQGWGMTETSPLVTFSRPPAGTDAGDEARYAAMTGRVMPGLQIRVTGEDGETLPRDGVALGELELRGPTVTGAYLGRDDDPEKFRDGWLRTGDLGVVHPGGWVEIKDRLKDGIKSGGEWISTVELENALVHHPSVDEAVVVGVPDPKWEERPFACLRLRSGASVEVSDLRTFLEGHVARWCIPERWAFVDEIPRTSVGKPDKRRVREDYAAGVFSVLQPDG